MKIKNNINVQNTTFYDNRNTLEENIIVALKFNFMELGKWFNVFVIFSWQNVSMMECSSKHNVTHYMHCRYTSCSKIWLHWRRTLWTICLAMRRIMQLPLFHCCVCLLLTKMGPAMNIQWRLFISFPMNKFIITLSSYMHIQVH